MKKVILLLSVLMVSGTVASGQSLLERLGNRAKNAVENNLGNKVEKGVNDVLNGKSRNKKGNEAREEAPVARAAAGWECPECGAQGNKGKFCAECGAKQPSAAPAAASSWTCPECGKTGNTGKFCDECGAKQSNVANPTTEAVKSDFVRGSVVLFQDDFKNEQVGEFPSKWDVKGEGNAETAVINGQKYLHYTSPWNQVEPLMENMKSYMPDVFTLEWDMFCSKEGDFGQSAMYVVFDFGQDVRAGYIEITARPWAPDYYGGYSFKKPNTDEEVGGAMYWDILAPVIKMGQWNHLAVSFNKRALKFYINDQRIFSLPNVQAPERFSFIGDGDYRYVGFTNVLLCAGAKELYAQETTNLSEAAKAVEKAIAETGKFVTNNILFDTGKATIKPESIPEIQKVAEYMKSNPAARFEVQGHTDNQGSDKINDPLSQQRAEAVVKALEEQGVDPFNLRPVGKGSHEPVADNKTEDGRAKNRRVEFVKK